MTIAINYAGSGAISECLTIEEARAILEDQYPGCVFAEQWDADGTNDEGRPMERLLVWASEQDADNDPGVRAVAQIERLA